MDNIDGNEPVTDDRLRLELELRELARIPPGDGLNTLLEMGRVISKPRNQSAFRTALGGVAESSGKTASGRTPPPARPPLIAPR